MSPAVPTERLESAWAEHAEAWRDPAAVIAGRDPAPQVEAGLLRARERGPFWSLLAERKLTLLVTREYEHLVVALSVTSDGPRTSYLALPHPSGLAYDPARELVHVAATRNPNQLVTLAPVAGVRQRADMPTRPPQGGLLLPRSSRYLAGCLYMHDLAMIGGRLHANAVGENAVVRFDGDGAPRRVWWPRTIESADGGPDFSRNYLQLNSIAAGPDLKRSFFPASAERPSRRRPGQLDFPVRGRGVIFSGRTREAVVRGLTRPHSARLHEGSLWVDNSGYGEVGIGRDGRFEAVARLPGWTRGLCCREGVAFVGTSRVIPRFRRYAPGLDVDKSECAVHALDMGTGRLIGSLVWPRGNQIFAIEATPRSFTIGFPQSSASRAPKRLARLLYSFYFDKEV